MQSVLESELLLQLWTGDLQISQMWIKHHCREEGITFFKCLFRFIRLQPFALRK